MHAIGALWHSLGCVPGGFAREKTFLKKSNILGLTLPMTKPRWMNIRQINDFVNFNFQPIQI